MNRKLLKKIGVYAGIILLFAGIAYGFVPEVLSGKIVNQSDIAGWKGMAQETLSHNQAHPEDPTVWTNSMFGGMPVTAMYDNFKGDWTDAIYDFLLLGKRPASYLFIALLGAFLLMLSMGINGLVAVAGAIAIVFCSYNMQIIQVGHNTKMQAIAYFPWVLAGIIYTYRAASAKHAWLPKTLLGATLFGLALSMQIKANHLQITYYLAIVILIYVVALFISICMSKVRKETMGRFFAASAMLLVVGCLGIATNANKLIPTYEYTPYTMRGGSELKGEGTGHSNNGLDLEYATAWSYGIEEMPNLLIPNFNGGSSSGPLDKDSETGKLLKRAGQPNLRETLKHMPLYWGPQPFTAGPMYMGAISIFLFILGIFLCRGREKWWIVSATVLAVLLAWGSHFMWFTKLWFDYVPMYNKFRTVSMALVVLQVMLPLLGFYTLDNIIKYTYSKKEFLRHGLIAYGLTAGFCLICMLIPGIAGSFTGSVDAGQPDILIDALATDRRNLLKLDAFRSFSLITVMFALILWAFSAKEYSGTKGRMSILAVAVIVLVWVDLYSIGKRYLNEDHFVTPADFTAQYELRPVDRIILEDPQLDYRVLDLSVNTFNSSIPSYHHKTIGGYSPVKLQRYQDLIERHITPEIRKIYDVVGKSATVQDVSENLPQLDVISMLNGKYIILGPDYSPVVNPHAMGNAWFVDSFVPAADPDEEIALLTSTDLRNTAIIGEDFSWARQHAVYNAGTDMREPVIEMTHYAPNELRYNFSTESQRAAIFSEIFYPKGWKAWIEPAGEYGEVRNGQYHPTDNGRSIELFRADWMLRGAVIPQGEGQLIMRFEPDSYKVGENISRGTSITLIVLLILAAAGLIIRSSRK